MLNEVASVVRFGLDSPYRIAASIVGLASITVLSSDSFVQPSEALLALGQWIGLDIAAPMTAVEAWVNEPSRRYILGHIAVVMLALSAIGWALVSHDNPGTWRLASTCVLSFGIWMQTSVSVGFLESTLILVVVALTLMKAAKREGSDALGFAVLDMFLALGFAVLAPLLWALSRPNRRPT